MAARGRSSGGGSRFVSGLVVGVLLSALVALVLLLRSPSAPVGPGGPATPAASKAPVEHAELPPSPVTAAPPQRETGPQRREATAPRPGETRRDDAASKSGGSATPAPQDPGNLPRVAIVIDDCGQRLDLLERAIRCRVPLTFAIIPHLPYSRESAERAHAAGREIIVHQPMEPDAPGENPGQGAIVSGMRRDKITRILRESFEDVPHAVGMNNHMGSRATSDEGLMESTFSALAQVRPGALFLDSRTTAGTVAMDVARRKGIRAAQRSVFLDNDLDAAAIRSELDRLVQVATEQGQAVAIGHLKEETLAVLEAMLPGMDGRDCRFVFLSDLVR